MAISELRKTSTMDDQRIQRATWLLVFVRWLWLLAAPLCLALTCYFLPLQVSLAETVCSGAQCSQLQPNPGTLQELTRLGISLNMVTIIIVAVIGACALTWLIIAAIIAWKNFSNWYALSVSLLGLSQMAMAARPPDLLPSQQTFWLLSAIAILYSANLTIYVIVGALFPNGKLAPRWISLILLSWLAIGLPSCLLAYLPLPLPPAWQYWLGMIGDYVWDACIIAIISAHVYRYKRLFRPIERQQTKWVLFFGAIALLQQLIASLLNLFLPAWFAPGSLTILFYFPMVKLFLTLFGLALLFAMLHYRLWDIDRLINRALVYGLLTGVLALVYAGLLFAAQALLFALTGQTRGNPLVLVFSTLVIAALFRPLRAPIQQRIDRRFYRQKYDASKVVADFTNTLRTVVDLPELQRQLIQAVMHTMQPESISLWLLPTRQNSPKDL
jgi:hypothetical protein